MKPQEIITNRIIQDIEANKKLSWIKGWAGGDSNPQNVISGREYQGINLFLLGNAPYTDNRWATYKQAIELGGNVKKGEAGYPVVFWKINKAKEADKNGTFKSFPLLRYYTLFNVEQCENLKIDDYKIKYESLNKRILQAEALINEYKIKTDILYKIKESGRAFYSIVDDSITMPLLEQFNNSELFYSTFFHEIGHSTGISKRLNREEMISTNYGSETYGKEELTAELTSAFVCSKLGISNESTEKNSSAYIQGWLKAIKGDSSLIISASQRASKAYKYIFNETINEVNN